MLRLTASSARPATMRAAARRMNHRINYTPNPAKANEFVSHLEHVSAHARNTTSLWRNISIATVPILIACAWYVYGKESHHLEHAYEVSKIPDEQWPEELEYQNTRNKRYFWGNGDKTPFWSWANHHKGHSD